MKTEAEIIDIVSKVDNLFSGEKITLVEALVILDLCKHNTQKILISKAGERLRGS